MSQLFAVKLNSEHEEQEVLFILFVVIINGICKVYVK